MEEDRKSGAESRVSSRAALRNDEADVEGHVASDVTLEPQVALRNEGADDEPDVEGHKMSTMDPGKVGRVGKVGKAY